jgi:Leucine-rich repeat (LRR) protein
MDVFLSSIEHQTLEPSFSHQALDSSIYFQTLDSSFGHQDMEHVISHQVRLLFHLFPLTSKLGSFLASLLNLKHLQMLSLDDNKLSNLPKLNGKATINYYYKWKCCNKIL